MKSKEIYNKLSKEEIKKIQKILKKDKELVEIALFVCSYLIVRDILKKSNLI